MRGARPDRAVERLAGRALALVPGARLLVACSGGPDSVALALVAARAARAAQATLILGHVDHAVRASSAQDGAIVLSLGARLGVAARIVRLAPPRDDEATLRTLRYEALAQLARDHDCRAIALAHTAEDQTETVLLALFRGSGLDGLGGMPVARPLAGGLTLVRPLLRATHAECLQVVRSEAAPYVLDPANERLTYRRVAVRRALAALREDFPGLDRAVARCAAIVADEAAGTPRAAARRAVRAALRASGPLRDVPFARIEAALDARDE